jgi:translation elongation factor EF-4
MRSDGGRYRRLKLIGSVEIPQEAFMALLRVDDD